MSHKYFFIEKNGESVVLSKEDERHLVRVLRSKIDSLITVSDGNGTDYLCKISSLDPFMLMLEREETPVVQRRKISMFISLAKGDKLSLMIQKCTELGADEFYILPTENSDVKVQNSEVKIQRYNRIILEAAKQCGRSSLPKISYINNLNEALSLCGGDIFLCHEKANERLIDLALPKRLSLFIGPEGGFSDVEVSLMQEKGAKAVLISNNILRCETAAITAVAIAMEASF